MEGGRNLHHLQPLETDTVLNYKLREGGTILARESGLGGGGSWNVAAPGRSWGQLRMGGSGQVDSSGQSHSQDIRTGRASGIPGMVEPNPLFLFSRGPERSRDLVWLCIASRITSRTTLVLFTTQSDFLGPLLPASGQRSISEQAT